MIFADKLIMGVNMFPTGIGLPGSYTTQTIVSLSGSATYRTGVLSDTGWYRVKIGAADGGTAINAGKGGYASQIFYAYSGTKYIIWGCHGATTGYPNPSGNGGDSTTSATPATSGALGGGGAQGGGRTYVFFNPNQTIVAYGGPGGGSAMGNGGASNSSAAPSGGAGSGFICGMDKMGTTLATETESFSDTAFSVDSVIAMVLAGGGGANGGSGGGGGGGAWGNGGDGASWTGQAVGSSTVWSPSTIPGATGPGGTSFGAGTSGTNRYMTKTSAAGVSPPTYSSTGGDGGNGGWCIRDYSTNTFSSGSGANGRTSAEICVLEKLIY